MMLYDEIESEASHSLLWLGDPFQNCGMVVWEFFYP